MPKKIVLWMPNLVMNIHRKRKMKLYNFKIVEAISVMIGMNQILSIIMFNNIWKLKANYLKIIQCHWFNKIIYIQNYANFLLICWLKNYVIKKYQNILILLKKKKNQKRIRNKVTKKKNLQLKNKYRDQIKTVNNVIKY